MKERKVNFRMKWRTEFFGSNPKIVPATTVSSKAMEAERADHSTMRTRNFLARRYSKRKSEGRQNHPRRRWSGFSRNLKMRSGKRSWKKCHCLRTSQRENVIMNRFLDILTKKEGWELRTFTIIASTFSYAYIACFWKKTKTKQKKQTTHAVRIIQEWSTLSTSIQLSKHRMNKIWVLQLGIVIIGCLALFWDSEEIDEPCECFFVSEAALNRMWVGCKHF